MVYYIILSSIAFLFSACSGKEHPKMLSFTPASVVIDYTGNDLYEATRLAQQFCDSIKKDAQYVRTEETGWISKTKSAFFNCIESSSKTSSNANGNGHIINNIVPPIVNNNSHSR